MKSITLPRSGVTAKSRKIDQAKLDGFNMGLLAGCAVLNDAFDFTDEELHFFLEQCNEVVNSISSGNDSASHIIRELEKMTGIEFTFGK